MVQPQITESLLILEYRVQTLCELVSSNNGHNQDQHISKPFQIRIAGI